VSNTDGDCPFCGLPATFAPAKGCVTVSCGACRALQPACALTADALAVLRSVETVDELCRLSNRLFALRSADEAIGTGGKPIDVEHLA
jgi:hypothetical protein